MRSRRAATRPRTATVVTGAAVGAGVAYAGAVATAVSNSNSPDEFADYGAAALEATVEGGIGSTIAGYANAKLSCFVAGTPALTDDGGKAIECIRAGDLVWAWDEETGDVALKPVVETYINETTELTHIFVGGEEIVCTPTHPFYCPVKVWTDAAHLRAGDILVLVNGEYVVVEQVQHELLASPVKVYNFQVEDYHTYYVSDNGVLVHNRCGKNINKTMSRSDAIKEGKEFLGDGYTKIGNGHYRSGDGYRTMRFDFTHHGGTPAHINLEMWENPVAAGARNKIRRNIHIFFE